MQAAAAAAPDGLAAARTVSAELTKLLQEFGLEHRNSELAAQRLTSVEALTEFLRRRNAMALLNQHVFGKGGWDVIEISDFEHLAASLTHVSLLPPPVVLPHPSLAPLCRRFVAVEAAGLDTESA